MEMYNCGSSFKSSVTKKDGKFQDEQYEQDNNLSLNSSYDSLPSYQVPLDVKTDSSTPEKSQFISYISQITPVSSSPLNLQHEMSQDITFSNGFKSLCMKEKDPFSALGFMDKDVSWVSSMASPVPKSMTWSNLNTVERATFLPDESYKTVRILDIL